MGERCPNCMNYINDSNSNDHISDGQGYEWSDTYYYTCDECGCEFEVKEETTKSVEVTTKGKEVE